ncbi:MAG: copper resistance system multicopper oxidase [Sulfuritalea sp.]|jgi:CopA family copper-resistance protein|uniref:copper resistance system multicopper oxidase n=1 Tax=Denitratisoma sp. DHT3 TaxID=1981880 RepID=UPI0011989B42|nr:copper resistance system multicopper oxidase [Denitratisoma sp. DHT3]MDK9714770.1 copper resistance system multicopper oxidase [Sulfuritalea sp.]QDX80966.1 copper resistance protein CopA [Denitratisoma sp. DHT3]
MNLSPFLSALPAHPARRRFVQGLAAGGVLAGMSPLVRAAFDAGRMTATGSAPVITGTDIQLVVAETPANFTGSQRMATTINGSLPAPTLRLREGDTVTIRVTNRLAVSTSIHWHGIILPYQMDGVPGISFGGIAPGETFTYRFQLRQSGTYWYHSHSGHQEQTGMYGAIIVEPRQGETIRADRDYVVHLSDWTDEDPARVFAKLKAQSDYYNFSKPTVADFFDDVSRDGMAAALDKRRMWNEMRMNPTDLADLSAATYTYLMNGTTPSGNWTGLFNPGERVRLRFINGAANSFYDVRIPGLKMTVVQSDGVNVEPVSVDEFRFGPGETYDVLVEPKDDAHTIFAQSMDRSGYARGTLAVRAGLEAAVQATDKVEWLTMADMMGDMGGMDHGAMPGMDHGAMPMPMQGAMPGMNHGAMAMDHSQHMMGGNPLAKPTQEVRHARTEYGPGTDMRVNTPRTNLDDPGIGLRNNGRRVLTLADLATIGGPLDTRGPAREIELHLTGNMERYVWSFDGLEFGGSTPVHFEHGERVRVILQNDTMMTHPMHMHGLWSELETAEGRFQARRHTLSVQPAQRISFLVTADALGRWAWHCHLMFHMHSGMFREVVVA